MIDFHNHVLPDVDDGSKDFIMSVNMLKEAARQGITEVVNTVHFQSPRMDGKNVEIGDLKSKLEKLQELLTQKGIPVKLHLGAEVFYLPNLLDLKDNPLLTFGSGKYMLVEFPFNKVPNGCLQVLFNLKMAGITPIIAHPERIKPIQSDLSIVRRMIRTGCLIQVDAGSVAGTLGKSAHRASIEIMKQSLCHILGSDAHDDRRRNFQLAEAVKIVKDLIDKDAAEEMVTANPKCILNGEEVVIREMESHYQAPTFLEKVKQRFFKRNYTGY